jgi:hypothetical protein
VQSLRRKRLRLGLCFIWVAVGSIRGSGLGVLGGWCCQAKPLRDGEEKGFIRVFYGSIFVGEAVGDFGGSCVWDPGNAGGTEEL